MLRTLCKSGLISALLTLPLTAQTTVTADIPGPGVGATAPSRATLFQAPRNRFQAVVGRSHLTGLVGSLLTRVTFRHLNANGLSIGAGEVNLKVTLSSASHTPCTADSRFDGNHGLDVTTVFDGTYKFNKMSAYGGSLPTPWADSRNLNILFTKPFHYSGQDLCLEVESWQRTGSALPEWHGRGLVPAYLPTNGTLYGTATKGTNTGFTPRVFGIPGPGETFPLSTDGVRPNLPAVLIVGISATGWGPLPLPLTVSHAAGNPVQLLTSPDIILPTVTRSQPPVVGMDGKPLATQPASWHLEGWAQLDLQVPYTPNLAACSIYAQWFALTDIGTPLSLQLAASQGLRLDLVGSQRHLDLAWLYAETTQPQTRPDRAASPTLRFAPEFRLTGTR